MTVKQLRLSLERVSDILSNKSTSKFVKTEDQLRMPLKTKEYSLSLSMVIKDVL